MDHTITRLFKQRYYPWNFAELGSENKMPPTNNQGLRSTISTPHTHQMPPQYQQFQYQNYDNNLFEHGTTPNSMQRYNCMPQPQQLQWTGNAEQHYHIPNQNYPHHYESLQPPQSLPASTPDWLKPILSDLELQVRSCSAQYPNSPQYVISHAVEIYTNQFCAQVNELEKIRSDEIQAVQQKHNEQESKCEQYKASNENYKQQLEALTASKLEMKHLLNHVSQERNKLKEKLENNTDVIQLRDDYDNLLHRVQDVYTNLRQQQMENQRMDVEIRTLHLDKKALEEKIAEREKYVSMNKLLQDELKRENIKVEDMTKTNCEQVDEIKSLTGKNKSFLFRIHTLLRDLSDKQDRIGVLEKKLNASARRVSCKALHLMERVRRAKQKHKLETVKKENKLRKDIMLLKRKLKVQNRNGEREKNLLVTKNENKDMEIHRLKQELDDNMGKTILQIKEIQMKLKESENKCIKLEDEQKCVLELALQIMTLNKCFDRLALKTVYHAEENKILKVMQKEIGEIQEMLEKALQDHAESDLVLARDADQSTSSTVREHKKLVEILMGIKEKLGYQQKTFEISKNKPILVREDRNNATEEPNQTLQQDELDRCKIGLKKVTSMLEKLKVKYENLEDQMEEPRHGPSAAGPTPPKYVKNVVKYGGK
ncbi:unnamed protein product [Orchesella dallaii]|uniref:Uncharacterized protein n=1 Tax=Orchesella dallaii TaxID=48710 RepID=A0ABP1R3S6_9HEXA